jgi:hypothetical protein
MFLAYLMFGELNIQRIFVIFLNILRNLGTELRI